MKLGAVIITMGNRPDELRTLLDSVAAQDGDRIEVVVVGNGAPVPDVPPGVKGALERTLRPDKAERFATADDMRRALVHALEDTGHRAAPETARPFLVEVLGDVS